MTQLLLLPGSEPDRPLAILIPLDGDVPGRIEALLRFWQYLQGRPPPPDTRLTARQRARLRQMIRATDGRASGASYREIAIALFGAARVSERPWKTSSLRDTVIALVEGGAALIAGGYRNLLRHRRRS